MFYRWGMLYPLYIIAEGELAIRFGLAKIILTFRPSAGIIFTDLAELLGTAIAFNL